LADSIFSASAAGNGFSLLASTESKILDQSKKIFFVKAERFRRCGTVATGLSQGF
jgi:hypothetical protein